MRKRRIEQKAWIEIKNVSHVGEGDMYKFTELISDIWR